MFTITCSEPIACPPEAVFAFAGDYANDPLWRQGVLAMSYPSGAPPKVGATTHETMQSLGRTAVTVAEIIEYTPSRTAFRSVSGPVPCDGFREFVACGDGTRFTYSLTVRPEGRLRLLAPLLRVVLRRQVREDLRRLKRRLEARARGRVDAARVAT